MPSAGDQALSDFRPRARRAFRILRPALVAIRARKPWRCLRTRFEGWNVRFDMGLAPSILAGGRRLRTSHGRNLR